MWTCITDLVDTLRYDVCIVHIVRQFFSSSSVVAMFQNAASQCALLSPLMLFSPSLLFYCCSYCCEYYTSFCFYFFYFPRTIDDKTDFFCLYSSKYNIYGGVRVLYLGFHRRSLSRYLSYSLSRWCIFDILCQRFRWHRMYIVLFCAWVHSCTNTLMPPIRIIEKFI